VRGWLARFPFLTACCLARDDDGLEPVDEHPCCMPWKPKRHALVPLEASVQGLELTGKRPFQLSRAEKQVPLSGHDCLRSVSSDTEPAPEPGAAAGSTPERADEAADEGAEVCAVVPAQVSARADLLMGADASSEPAAGRGPTSEFAAAPGRQDLSIPGGGRLGAPGGPPADSNASSGNTDAGALREPADGAEGVVGEHPTTASDKAALNAPEGESWALLHTKLSDLTSAVGHLLERQEVAEESVARGEPDKDPLTPRQKAEDAPPATHSAIQVAAVHESPHTTSLQWAELAAGGFALDLLFHG